MAGIADICDTNSKCRMDVFIPVAQFQFLAFFVVCFYFYFLLFIPLL